MGNYGGHESCHFPPEKIHHTLSGQIKCADLSQRDSSLGYCFEGLFSPNFYYILGYIPPSFLTEILKDTNSSITCL